ncbi:thioesterase domain-containing protein [Kitasatospora sp. NPDC056731]|uniref:thioesterase II family protein n=1 Tax=Kitasatospora sp. NPDC056731 TaxID=3155422 RepID=UPI0034381ED1
MDSPAPPASGTAQPSIAVLAARPAARTLLYCLPPSGLGPSYFSSWAAVLPPTVELRAVALPGREALADTPSWTDPAPLAASIARCISTDPDPRPYALFGHSVGALLAFETARRLQRLGHRPPELLALSGLAAPHLGTYRTAMPQLLLAGREGIAELLGPLLLDDADTVLAVGIPFLADVLLMLHYRYQDDQPLQTSLAVYGGRDDPLNPLPHLEAWNDLATMPTPVRLFPGTHTYPNDQREALLRQLTADLTATRTPSATDTR